MCVVVCVVLCVFGIDLLCNVGLGCCCLFRFVRLLVRVVMCLCVVFAMCCVMVCGVLVVVVVLFVLACVI